MRRETIITGLICLNLGLLAGLGYVWKKRPVATQAPALTARNVATSIERPSRTITRTVHVPANQPQAPSRFTWRMLESTDFKKYIANLRAVNCPEQTIQDIVIAEVNKLYAGKEAALRLRPEHLKPWETFGVSARVAMQRERKLRELLREKRALLKELLGIDVPVEIPARLTGGLAGREARFEKAYEKLPEGKRDLVRAVQEGYWDKIEALNDRTMGFWEPQDYDEQRNLKKEYRDALAKTLTPDELTDFDLATSSTGNRLRGELSAFNASEEELREIFKARWKLDDEFSTLWTGNPNDPEGGRKRAEAQQLVEAEIKTVLGEQRYADYQRSRDYQFRNLSRVAQESGLPTDTAVKAYDVQRFARDEANKVRTNPELTRDQRDELLRQMQTELDATMGQLLGKEAYDKLQRNYGGSRIYYQQNTAGAVRTIVTPAPTGTPGTVILAP